MKKVIAYVILVGGVVLLLLLGLFWKIAEQNDPSTTAQTTTPSELATYYHDSEPTRVEQFSDSTVPAVDFIYKKDGSLFLMNTADGTSSSVPTAHDGHTDLGFDISADGSKLVYASSKDTKSPENVTVSWLYIFDQASKTTTALMNQPDVSAYHPFFSPDGEEVFYVERTYIPASKVFNDGKVRAINRTTQQTRTLFTPTFNREVDIERGYEENGDAFIFCTDWESLYSAMTDLVGVDRNRGVAVIENKTYGPECSPLGFYDRRYVATDGSAVTVRDNGETTWHPDTYWQTDGSWVTHGIGYAASETITYQAEETANWTLRDYDSTIPEENNQTDQDNYDINWNNFHLTADKALTVLYSTNYLTNTRTNNLVKIQTVTRPDRLSVASDAGSVIYPPLNELADLTNLKIIKSAWLSDRYLINLVRETRPEKMGDYSYPSTQERLLLHDLSTNQYRVLAESKNENGLAFALPKINGQPASQPEQ